MLLKALEMILILMLLNFGFGSAMYSPRPYPYKQHPSPDHTPNNGIKIISATCHGKYYDSYSILKVVERARHTLQSLEQLKIENQGFYRFQPRPGDKLPFEPPYFHFRVGVVYRLPDGNHEDSVVITKDAKLVGIVSFPIDTKGNYNQDTPWKSYINCLQQLAPNS